MSLPVIVRPEAEADIRETYDYLEQVRAGLGEQFSAALRAVLESIESMPEIYGVVWRDVRAVRLRKFQYVLYYVVFADRAEVLAILHGARHESAWRARVD
jgi:plasmid stabilization system protein ParE